jgi:hypothetical protein
MKNGIAVSTRLCHFTSESSRKESDCDGMEQKSGVVSYDTSR